MTSLAWVHTDYHSSREASFIKKQEAVLNIMVTQINLILISLFASWYFLIIHNFIAVYI